MKETQVIIDGYDVRLTNLDKLLWPEGLTKAHLVKYYLEIAPYILPHLYNRPLVMKRYPDGVNSKPFYQKECPGYAPDWIIRHPVKHTGKDINYIICNNLATLIWLANQGVIEMHPWLSRIENLEYPDIAVIDLDPASGTTFGDVLNIALLVRDVLSRFNLQSYPKTSGSTGLHIFIPIKPVYTYQIVVKAMQYISELVVKINPNKATVERKIVQREGRVYLDYLQNGRGKTMAFQYSPRPLPGAPISTPLYWDEVEELKITPDTFTIYNILSRVKKIGDIYSEILVNKQTLEQIIKLLQIPVT